MQLLIPIRTMYVVYIIGFYVKLNDKKCIYKTQLIYKPYIFFSSQSAIATVCRTYILYLHFAYQFPKAAKSKEYQPNQGQTTKQSKHFSPHNLRGIHFPAKIRLMTYCANCPWTTLLR